ncbi:atypical membrane-integrating protein (Mistic protein) [Fictibacillus terranigra]|uniref:Atypical membrane-integrating protein (Mistic protein) n=1 Tax=Fictibacillus terranigra TaxID=3058424 RepID=A0ABT8E3D4_9BACL|nr:atypical membrane-integrating protein (Mistic protein) [Fictibacillus sp. CENA-BCM004]MDN4072423.1 atypical membrane-integrating protein (Mistic protein) [Fictibacillus sp. CENA-BCM004]
MKLNKKSKKLYSDAIDRMQEGLEAMIDLYNEAEEDVPLIQFEKEVQQEIEKAKEKFGSSFIDGKINAIVKEVLSFLPIDDAQADQDAKD